MTEHNPKCETIVRHEGDRPIACKAPASACLVFRRRKDAPPASSFVAGSLEKLLLWYKARGETSAAAVLCDRHRRKARRQGLEVFFQ